MTNSKSVLFLSTSIGFGAGSDYGGGEHFASEFVQELSLRGWKVILVCPPQSPMLKDMKLMAAVSKSVPLDISIKITSPFNFILILLKWLLISRQFRNAIIYANGYESMKWAVSAKHFWHQPVVCHLHESTYEAYESKRAQSIAPHVDHFFAISHDVRTRFSRGTGTPETKISIIYNGVPVAINLDKNPRAISEIRGKHGLSATAPLVFMAARTTPEKGHIVFIKAAKIVLYSRPEVIFLIAGLQNKDASETKVYERIVSQIQSLHIGNNVLHTGYTIAVRDLMRASDIVVVPSTAEGFGRTAIEAMAEGTPVIASKVGGLAEIITHDINGRHFPVGDEQALAKEILFLLENPEKCHQLAEKGRSTVLEGFSTMTMTDKIERLLLGA